MLKAWLQRRIPAPPVHLGPSSHTGFDAMPQHVARNALTKFLNQGRPFRTRSHQAHVALAHVPELWQFVQACTPEEGAQRRAAWIVFLSPHSARLTLSIVAHGAKFHYVKDRAIKAHTVLHVEHWTTGGKFHENGNQRQHREREQQRRHTNTEVEGTLHNTVPTVHGRAAQGDDRQALKFLDTAT